MYGFLKLPCSIAFKTDALSVKITHSVFGGAISSAALMIAIASAEKMVV